MLFKKGKASDMNYSSEPETFKLANVLLGSFALFCFVLFCFTINSVLFQKKVTTEIWASLQA